MSGAGVTDNKKVRGDVFTNRNGELLCEHGLSLILGRCKPCSKRGADEKHHRFILAAEAKSNAESCGKCGKDIATGEPVAIWNVGIGTTTRAAICLECVPAKHLAGTKVSRPATPEPCAGCSRDVYFGKPGMLGVFCSERCRARRFNAYHSARRKARRRRHLDKTCLVCNEPFTAKRSDAKTCSPACKQKAYRARQRRSEHGESG